MFNRTAQLPCCHIFIPHHLDKARDRSGASLTVVRKRKAPSAVPTGEPLHPPAKEASAHDLPVELLEQAINKYDLVGELIRRLEEQRTEAAEKVRNASKEWERSNKLITAPMTELNARRCEKVIPRLQNFAQEYYGLTTAKEKAQQERLAKEVRIAGEEAVKKEKSQWEQATEEERIKGKKAVSIAKVCWSKMIENERVKGEDELKKAKESWKKFLKDQQDYVAERIKEEKMSWDSSIEEEREIGIEAVEYEHAE